MTPRTRLSALLLLLTALVCGAPDSSAAGDLVTLAACALRPLVDNDSGAAIIGPEDIAADPANGDLYVSAYDRAALVRWEALFSPHIPYPEGGIYRLDPASLSAEGDVEATRLTLLPQEEASLTQTLRPHGIDLKRIGGRLYIAYVSRGHRMTFGRPEPIDATAIARIHGGDRMERQVFGTLLTCRANDVAFLRRDGVPLSYAASIQRPLDPERPYCRTPWFMTVAAMLSGDDPRGGIRRSPLAVTNMRDETAGFGDQLDLDLLLANGIAALSAERLLVADTRRGQVHLIGADDNILASIDLPLAPDNISPLEDGRFAVAGFGNLLRLAAYRSGLVGPPPPQAVILSVDDLALSLDAAIEFPPDVPGYAATSALRTETGHWLFGNALEAELLICREAGID